MKAGTVTVANVYEATVDADVDIGGATYTIRPREGAQLGTLTQGNTLLYATAEASFTPLVLPVDWVP